MPTYKVDRPGSNQPRIVDAANPAAARQHVARDELTVTKIGASEAFKLASEGCKLETAGAEPVAAGAAPYQGAEGGPPADESE